MRSDMFEIIIERPRYYGGKAKSNRAKEHVRRDPEHAPMRESMSISRGTKSLNENLAPLRRFLQRRVGRPWNEVFAEISAHIALRSAVQKHVLDHLWQFVKTDVVLIDGQPHYPLATGSTRSRYLPFGFYHRGFYVCPKTGILRATPQVARKRKEPPLRDDLRRLDERTDARRIGGVWYRVTFAKLPQAYADRKTCYDVVLRAWVTEHWMSGRQGSLEREHGRRDEYAVAARPLTGPELRALGVANLTRSRHRPS